MANRERPKGKENSNTVKVRKQKALAVWAHGYVFLSPTRTVATLVFAAMRGTITSGETIKIPKWDILSISCDVDIEFIDDTLVVGARSRQPPVQINALKELKICNPNSTSGDTLDTYDPKKSDTLNEFALWLTVSPIVIGISVEGAQPMYVHPGRQTDTETMRLPTIYVNTAGGSNDLWTIPYLEHFIRVSIDASAMTYGKMWSHGKKVTMTSVTDTLKLDT